MAHTLALNADWSPLGMLPLSSMNWQDAVRALYIGTVRTLHEYETWTVHSPSCEVRIPSVVITKRYVKLRRTVAFTNEMVFLRDGYRCQYCGNKFHTHDLTVDHVLPKSQGGKRNFQNLVAACTPCNSRRGNNASIKPRNLPHRPSYGEMVNIAQRMPISIPHESWLEYIGWDPALVTVNPPLHEPGFLPRSEPHKRMMSLLTDPEPWQDQEAADEANASLPV